MDKTSSRILALTVFVAVGGVVVGLILRDEGNSTLSAAGLAALSALLTLIVTSIFQAERDQKRKEDEDDA